MIIDQSVQILFKILRFFRQPLPLTLIFATLSVVWLIKGPDCLQRSTSLAQAEAQLQRLAQENPSVANWLAALEDEQYLAMVYATGTASEMPHPRSALSDLSRDAQHALRSGRLPHKARVFEVSQTRSWTQTDRQLGFIETHATAGQLLARGDPDLADRYFDSLDAAARDEAVFQLVRDDSLALSLVDLLGTDINALELISVYKRNRDWLAEPLAMIDLAPESDSTLTETYESVLIAVRDHEKVVRTLVHDEGLAHPALFLMATHGSLIAAAHKTYDLDPGEVASIVYANPDVFHNELRPTEIADLANRLNLIHQRHASVYTAAQSNPFALRLYFDAPAAANDLFDRYPDLGIPHLIYSLSDVPGYVQAAAKSVVLFGDLAIHILARYRDTGYADRLVELFEDPRINLATVPFVARFQDDAFMRAEDDVDWVRRYFDSATGWEKVDRTEWLTYIPGGTLYKVAENWANGLPSEPSELGWAAWDVADILLTMASGGASKIVTSPVIASRRLADASTKAARAGARLKDAASITATASIAKPGSSASRRTMLKQAATKVRDGAGFTYRFFRTASGKAVASIVKIRKKWLELPPGRRKLVIRASLGASLFYRFDTRTLPNMDKIGEGVGRMIADVGVGIVKALGSAATSFVKRTLDEILPTQRWLRDFAYWLVALGLLGATTLFGYKGYKMSMPMRFGKVLAARTTLRGSLESAGRS